MKASSSTGWVVERTIASSTAPPMAKDWENLNQQRFHAGSRNSCSENSVILHKVPDGLKSLAAQICC